MSRKPVAASLLLYISLQVICDKYKIEAKIKYLFQYFHSIVLNAVQIIFVRMNEALTVHVIANEQIYVCANLSVWKSGYLTETYEYRDSFEKYLESFPSSPA